MHNFEKTEIIIISYNTCQLVCNCIDSIIKSVSKHNCDVTVFDNNSSDNTIEYLSLYYPLVKIIKSDQNLGYARSINRAVNDSKAEFIIVSNSDVEFHEHSIETLTSFLAKYPTVGVVGPQQVFPDGAWQRSYGYIPGVREGLFNLLGITSLMNLLSKRLWNNRTVCLEAKSVPYIDGAVLAFRRSSFDAVGGFDEDFFFYSEEADFCYRLKKSGWDACFVPSARVMHLRGGSSRNFEVIDDKYLRMQMDSKLLFVSKHFPSWHSVLYVMIQALHFLKMYLVTKIASYLTGGVINKRLTSRAETFSRLKFIWSEQFFRFIYRQGG